jgi:hypothetical protein
MKRLILIQNDYPGAGKTTLGQCLHHYLETLRVPHHSAAIVESSNPSRTVTQIEGPQLRRSDFIAELDRSDLVIIEIETGIAELFASFYKKHDLESLIPELGFELIVAVPVTSDRESFDGVTAAAETYSDAAQYLVVHTPTSSLYDADESCWERSYPARVMDMFEAAELEMPPCPEALELRLKVSHTALPDAMSDPKADPALHDEVSKWFRRVSANLDTTSKYLFGDAFRPAVVIKPPTRVRRTRAKATAPSPEPAA